MEFNGGIYYNPASAAVRERIASGAAEIAANYPVDGIHFDDYFYPYPVNGKSFNLVLPSPSFCAVLPSFILM